MGHIIYRQLMAGKIENKVTKQEAKYHWYHMCDSKKQLLVADKVCLFMKSTEVQMTEWPVINICKAFNIPLYCTVS